MMAGWEGGFVYLRDRCLLNGHNAAYLQKRAVLNAKKLKRASLIISF